MVTVTVQPQRPTLPESPKPEWYGINTAGWKEQDEATKQQKLNEYYRDLAQYNAEKEAILQRYREEVSNYNKYLQSQKEKAAQDKAAQEAGYENYSDYLSSYAESKKEVVDDTGMSSASETNSTYYFGTPGSNSPSGIYFTSSGGFSYGAGNQIKPVSSGYVTTTFRPSSVTGSTTGFSTPKESGVLEKSGYSGFFNVGTRTPSEAVTLGRAAARAGIYSTSAFGETRGTYKENVARVYVVEKSLGGSEKDIDVLYEEGKDYAKAKFSLLASERKTELTLRDINLGQAQLATGFVDFPFQIISNLRIKDVSDKGSFSITGSFGKELGSQPLSNFGKGFKYATLGGVVALGAGSFSSSVRGVGLTSTLARISPLSVKEGVYLKTVSSKGLVGTTKYQDNNLVINVGKVEGKAAINIYEEKYAANNFAGRGFAEKIEPKLTITKGGTGVKESLEYKGVGYKIGVQQEAKLVAARFGDTTAYNTDVKASLTQISGGANDKTFRSGVGSISQKKGDLIAFKSGKGIAFNTESSGITLDLTKQQTKGFSIKRTGPVSKSMKPLETTELSQEIKTPKFVSFGEGTKTTSGVLSSLDISRLSSLSIGSLKEDNKLNERTVSLSLVRSNPFTKEKSISKSLSITDVLSSENILVEGRTKQNLSLGLLTQTKSKQLSKSSSKLGIATKSLSISGIEGFSGLEKPNFLIGGFNPFDNGKSSKTKTSGIKVKRGKQTKKYTPSIEPLLLGSKPKKVSKKRKKLLDETTFTGLTIRPKISF